MRKPNRSAEYYAREAEKSRRKRAKLRERGLNSRGKPFVGQGKKLSAHEEAEKSRLKRKRLNSLGLNSRGKPLQDRCTLHPERDQRSWWLVTTQVPETVARLMYVTSGWGKQRFRVGDKLHPYDPNPIEEQQNVAQSS